MIVFDSDDFGCTHKISDQTQSRDCRAELDKLHYTNPNFKATLFAIPGEMTKELADWCKANESWIELALHGFYHRTNYECEKMTYEEFDELVKSFQPMLDTYFVKGFKGPGWQISDDIYRWLLDKGWWVADQGYNDGRRPKNLPTYVNYNGTFHATKADGVDYGSVNGIHTHTWSCEGNGIDETLDSLLEKIKDETEFRFISEVLND